MAVDWKEVWQDRLKQVRIDIKVAVKSKNWTKVAKLKSEEAELLDKIKKK